MAGTIEQNPAEAVGVTKAAKLLGYHPQTVRTMANAGEFPGAFRRGRGGGWRIPLPDIAAFTEQNSPHRTQTSSSGASADGDSSGPDRQDGDQPAEMPAGSFDTNPGQPAQEASNGHR